MLGNAHRIINQNDPQNVVKYHVQNGLLVNGVDALKLVVVELRAEL